MPQTYLFITCFSQDWRRLFGLVMRKWWVSSVTSRKGFMWRQRWTFTVIYVMLIIDAPLESKRNSQSTEKMTSQNRWRAGGVRKERWGGGGDSERRGEKWVSDASLSYGARVAVGGGLASPESFPRLILNNMDDTDRRETHHQERLQLPECISPADAC